MSEFDVRRQVSSYLVGAVSLRELHDWITSQIWSDEVSEDVRSLANQISLPLDEFSSGALSADELKAALRPLVTDYSVEFRFGSPAPVAVRFSTVNSSTSAAPPIMTPQFADTRLVTAS